MSYCEPCPLTAAARTRQSAFELLATIKELRDHWLVKTVKGRQIISLYKHCSPSLLKAVFLDRRFRSELLNGLEQLQPAIYAVQQSLRGHNEPYVFTPADVQTIERLLEVTIAKLPEPLALQTNKLKHSLALPSMAGQNIHDYLVSVKLS